MIMLVIRRPGRQASTLPSFIIGLGWLKLKSGRAAGAQASSQVEGLGPSAAANVTDAGPGPATVTLALTVTAAAAAGGVAFYQARGARSHGPRHWQADPASVRRVRVCH